MTITEIWSGGQSGADQGALHAGRQLGLKTGGWAPKGYRTEFGPNLELKRYGLHEHPSSEYPPRTRLNVHDTDATVWIGPWSEFDRGFRCTRRAAKDHKKKFLVVRGLEDAQELKRFVELHRIARLNVAGPAATHDRRAYARAVETLLAAFQE